METRRSYREIAIRIISVLFIVLFVYTAFMKIKEYEIFKIRLDRSPMLEGMGEWLAVLIPVALLVTALLLMSERTRLKGLFSATAIMMVFTGYIAVVLLFFSSSLPCSCNGVFEFLNWKQHLWFNMAFLLLAIAGVFLQRQDSVNPDERVLQPP